MSCELLSRSNAIAIKVRGFNAIEGERGRRDSREISLLLKRARAMSFMMAGEVGDKRYIMRLINL